MKKTLLIEKFVSENKMNRKMIEMKTTVPTTANIMIQTNKFNNNKIKQNNTDFLNENKWRKITSRTPYRNKHNINLTKAKTTSNNKHPRNSNSSFHIINRMRQQMSFLLNKTNFWIMLWLLVTLIQHVESLEMTTGQYHTTHHTSSSTVRYSQLLSTNGQMTMSGNAKSMDDVDDDTFRPFVPKDPEMISRNVFTPSGQFRVFQPIDTDLRAAVTIQSKSQHYGRNKMSEPLNSSSSAAATVTAEPRQTSFVHDTQQMTGNHKNTKGKERAHVEVYQIDSSNLSLTKHQKQQQQYHQHQQPEPQLHKTVKKTHEIKHQHEQEPEQHQYDHKQPINNVDVQRNEISKQDDLKSDFKNLEDLLVDYVTNFFEKGQYEPMPGLLVELQNNQSQPLATELTAKTRNVRQASFATDAKVKIDLPRTMATGRLLFLTGLKKVLWPVFMGLQVLKSLLIAMFIPAIIGSFTKLLGKGISTGSAPLFIRPMEAPQELDFRDNSINFDDDKFLVTDEGVKNNSPYAYNQPDASQMHNEYVFDPSSANNQLSYTRLGMNERQHQLMQDSYMSALQSIGSASFKNSGSLSSGSSGLVAPMAKRPPPAANVNTFQQFQNVPDSSLLLSNYDPFYSPLLSRLDSVFAQLKINSDKEMCREKLICLMYANPAKYAPYSNLVSAQLSRELNELRKPTSDNPDILRFFKYMRAAKDGQDGVDCEKTFDKCTEFKDFENPAMVSTYHDINKLVQARKLTNK
ncbi:uncharacterized protein LOC111684218 [Lucilia cuprina]|uniref:uncharacterized protein LOC111684218 n=1 Tax=Lucilia cuprina TaxID=7375 RepID=UPI001F0547AD|nr:uncharacterized protein LOC111684218 [Lucilia cuprina]XP_046806319.1 uncharacterized protein LOC111684218 [Lucilia cuprina]